MIDYDTSPENLKQQILDLAKKACKGDAAAGTEIVQYCDYCIQGYKKWLGTKKGRETNLRRAIRCSVADLKRKEIELTDENVIGNLWIINHGLNEVQHIILDIVPGRTKADSYVCWVNRKGSELETDFNSIHKMIKKVQADIAG